MQLLYSPLISCACVQEWKEAPTELSSISIYKNLLVICGLSHACNKDIFHSCCSLQRKSCLPLRAAGILLQLACAVTSLSSCPLRVSLQHCLISKGSMNNLFPYINACLWNISQLNRSQNRKDAVAVASTFPFRGNNPMSASLFVIFPINKWPNWTIPPM